MTRTRVWKMLSIIAVAGIFVLAFAINLSRNRLTAEQKKEVTYFYNVVFDLEHPTAENMPVRRLECAGFGDNATKWAAIPGLGKEVWRYVQACIDLGR